MGRERHLVGLMVAVCLALPAPLLANPNDISLRGLGRPQTQALSDPANRRYKALTSELAFALAPRPLAPAETLGISGFEISLASTTSDISENKAYWKGQPGNPIFEGVLPSHGSRGVPKVFWVPTVHIRKGLPLSSDIGITGAYLAWSEMTMLGLDTKIALHESYFRWVPALAVRGAVGRLFGASDLDMVTFEIDMMASLAFGVGGMAQVTPFLGYGWLFAHVNSQVIDETPYEVLDNTDQKGGPDGSLYTFPTLDWSDNSHGRFFLGFRINVAMLEVLYELDVGFLGSGVGTLVSNTFKLGFDV